MADQEKIYYQHCDSLLSLPTWGQFFITLGMNISQDTTKGKNIIAIAVPTRSYVGALLCTGIVVSLATSEHSDGHLTAPQIHELLRTVVGTQISLHEGRKTTTCQLSGIKHCDDGKTRLGFYFSKAKGGSLTRWILIDQCEVTTVSSGDKSVAIKQLPNHDREQDSQLIDFLIPTEQLHEFKLKSKLRCILIGSLNTLRREIMETEFAVRQVMSHGGPISTTLPLLNKNSLGIPKFARGTLQDILRVRRFSGGSKTYQSDVVAVESRRVLAEIANSQPVICVFDGASAFLKWRTRVTSNTEIVVLDKGEAHFKEATHVINEGYSSRTEVIQLGNIHIPSGIEITAYVVAS